MQWNCLTNRHRLFLQGVVTPLKIVQIICATPHHSLPIFKVLASLDQNSRRSYPKTNMLKNLSKGLFVRQNHRSVALTQYALAHLMVLQHDKFQLDRT